MRTPSVAALAVIVAAGPALADDFPIRLELRIVPQVGTLPGPISDLPGSVHQSVTSSDVGSVARTRRFEVQQRLVDLNPSDTFVPAGLSVLEMRVETAVLTGSAGSSTIRKAHLSDFEARKAGIAPPGPMDTSGLPPTTYTGSHRPFRGFAGDSAPFNGTVNGLNLMAYPTTLSQTDQGNIDAGLTGLEWYGLYSFELEIDPTATGQLQITVRPGPDPVTNNAFAFFTWDGVFRTGQRFSSATATLDFASIPAPGAVLLPLLALTTRRRRSR